MHRRLLPRVAPALLALSLALGLTGALTAPAGAGPDRSGSRPGSDASAGTGAGTGEAARAAVRALPTSAQHAALKPAGVRRAVFVGNNWDGTASIVTPGSFKRLGRINIIPDRAERMREIALNPYRLAYFLAIRALIGEGHDQFVDDMYSSNDGRLLVVSRPSFADVVAIDLRTQEIAWRFPVAGVRSDHMAVSPDGKRVVVSASTGNVVHVIRMKDGKDLGQFPSGGSPHESTYIDDGERILHASIGLVYTPLDDPALDPLKDDRVLQVVDARTNKVVRRYDLRKALDERGMTRVSTAVRPITLSPDEEKMYFQLSFFHGFVELDRRSGRITRVKRLPNLIPNTPRELYLLDSAHHGIAMNHRGTKICVAGTMSDYATVVDAKTFRTGKLLKGGLKPYWVTPSWNGEHCYISWSGSDTISKISYKTGRIVRTAKVGYHPQRVRNGYVDRRLVAGLPNHVPERSPLDGLVDALTP
ncbi:YncE family protein [Nocardioides deserti]|uniref:Serine/threonine protein kinase n=1 Tax=Nocardioides deserti TaxID=1588644 RepID=A0ABR6UBI3_9ACTN|nr:serine/threonine protein kinase [Nocardioides deserti]MBC2961708.1 serine/threonine protein kinase [Nocardioides deserti]GGO73023.1 serine/threonine protein kinase [Nocardioides deserti]